MMNLSKSAFIGKQMMNRSMSSNVVIQSMHAREIIDSRGNPTVEVDLKTNQKMYRASVPSGASTGIHEAVELRDGGSRYMGKGVLNACENVNFKIAPKLKGIDPTKQAEIDAIMLELDGTPNKANLGANAILGVSLAVAKAGADAKNVPLYQHFADLSQNDKMVLPVPAFNVINGGSHAGNKLAFQEFMIMPTGAASFTEAMVMGCEVYHHLKSVIKAKYGQDATNVGDEGGFAPNIQSNREGVELLMTAIQKANYVGKVQIAMDVASSEFFTTDGKYDLDFKTKSNDGTQIISGEELGQLYEQLCNEFPIVSIEDPFDQDDWKHYTQFTKSIGKKVQVVGDDLLCTNPARIQTAVTKNACNALLLKVNQIGSVTESLDAVYQSKQQGWGVMTSHRSGETEDSYIADLAVGLSTGQIKTGAPCRSERLSKYNQLLRIEEQMGSEARYAGKFFRSPSMMNVVSVPDGCVPLMISMREMDTYELKTGPLIQDTVNYKIFSREYILDQVQQVGFMCPFHGIRKEVGNMKIDKILIVADRDEVYGENWLVCLTQKAFDCQYAVLEAKEAEEEKTAEVESQIEGDEDIESEILVYEDLPVIAKEWTSSTMQETHQDVSNLVIAPRRSKLCVEISKPVKELNGDHKFTDRDADLGILEFRQHKDPNYELVQSQKDVGFQAGELLVNSSTQTNWFRCLNHALQYAPITVSTKIKCDEFQKPDLNHFLENASIPVVEALQQNETIDIFTDDLSLLEDDVGFGMKSESNIKELRSFMDLEFSKNKALAAIDWHPRKKGMVAVSAVSNCTYDERVQAAEQNEVSHVLIWNFVDLIHPQFVLESPQDVYAFRFNPTKPSIVAAGTFSGQVILWDLTEAEKVAEQKKHKMANLAAATAKNDLLHDMDASGSAIPPIQNIALSYIDYSHRNPVSDICWLPAGTEITHNGHICTTDDTVTFQFVTISGDGQVMFWDTRYKDPAHRSSTKLKSDKTIGKDGLPEVFFTPLYKIVLNKTDGIGEHGLRRIVLEKVKPDPQDKNNTIPSSRMYCTTEDGRMILADWKPGNATDSKSGEASGSLEFIQWVADDHQRPSVSLQQSPFYPEVLLSIGDTEFNLWRKDTQFPIFTSPSSLSSLTSGRWSPTRPSVILIGKADGSVDVWDMLDQSHQPSSSVSIAPCSINSLEFWGNTSSKSQLLAAGDANGNLHILDIPRTLWRAHANETSIMENSFFKRESDRLQYIKDKIDVLQKAETVDDHGNNNTKNELSPNSESPEFDQLIVGLQNPNEMFSALEHSYLEEIGSDIEASGGFYAARPPTLSSDIKV